jgi:4-diphosphocytidyl-2-C-methyl-D-erythritol kinase
MAEGPPGAVTALAPAKINLYLHVVGRRPDGYHLLDSLVAFAGVHDVVMAVPADDITLALDGPFGERLRAEPENLVLTAARRLAGMAGVRQGAALRLTKWLPVASGIGGGSADAAAALRALMRLWDVRLNDAELHALALDLGADVPVCLAGKAVFMGGIGEDLAPAPPLPPAWLLLVNPGTPVPTPAVFRRRHGPFSAAGRFAEAPADVRALAELLAGRGNDLTAPAIEIEPAIAGVLAELAALPGTLLTRMSGSGATCFALFADSAAAVRAALALGQAHPGWWVKAASLEGDAARLEG